MLISSDTHEKMMAVYELLQGKTISVSTFEHIRTLLKGLHPKIDEKLEIVSLAFDKLQKIQNADVITLTVEGLPEDTDEKKKRKKALLFFISSLKDLKSEIIRVNTEFTQTNEPNLARILRFAKGPFGIMTIIALVVVGFAVIPKSVNSPAVLSTSTTKMQIIMYKGKQIPLNQLHIGNGPDCDSPHYHAISGGVIAIDKTVIPDPGNCGYGKLRDVQVSEVVVNASPSPL